MTSKLLRFAPLALIMAGCGGGTPTAQVRGTVNFNGEPVKFGSVSFFPTGPTGGTASGTITDGKYTATASPGPMKVTIYSPKVVGQRKRYDTPDSPMDDIVVGLLPERYNVKSEMTADLKDGDNELDFDLKSDKK